MDWTIEQLNELKLADDLRVAPLRKDGVTPGTPTFIWSVVRRGGLYIRAYNGLRSRWYQAAAEREAGLISVAGKGFSVAFEAIDDEVLNDRIDSAYRAKYALSSYLPAMVSPRARASTLRVLPMVDLTVVSQQQLYPTFATLGRLSLLDYAPQKQSGIAPAFSI